MLLVPGRTVALAADAAVNLEHRVGPYTIQFFLDPSAVGANLREPEFIGTGGQHDEGAGGVGGVEAVGPSDQQANTNERPKGQRRDPGGARSVG